MLEAQKAHKSFGERATALAILGEVARLVKWQMGVERKPFESGLVLSLASACIWPCLLDVCSMFEAQKAYESSRRYAMALAIFIDVLRWRYSEWMSRGGLLGSGRC